MVSKYIRIYLGGLLFLVTFLNASIASADSRVTLQLANGNFIVEGELVGFNGKVYQLKTASLGQATFEAGRFICIDGSCPSVKVDPFLFHSSTSDFNIHGSNTIGSRLMPWIIRGYAKSKGLSYRESVSNNKKEVRFSLKDRRGDTATNINVYRYGSSTAFPALVKRYAVLGMSDRKIKKSEVEDIEKSGISNVLKRHEHVIGIDGIVVIVSRDNGVSSLTMDQLAGIFSGKITDWVQVGGRPGQINLYTPDFNSGTLSTFKSLVLKPRKMKVSLTANPIYENEKLSEAVAKDPNAIGITGFAYIDKAKAIGIKSSCGIALDATPFNIQTGVYPLSRRLYLYTTQVIENKHAVSLLNFAKHSKEMDSVLRVAGFIDRNISSVSFKGLNDGALVQSLATNERVSTGLLKKLMSDISRAKRLSYVARFETQSFNLSHDSKTQVRRLVAYLKKKVKPEQEIVIAGFSDSVGDFGNNLALSKKRANVFKTFLINALKDVRTDQLRFATRGYGELFPAACNDSDDGRQMNRRVEIWIKDAGSAVARKQVPVKSSKSTQAVNKAVVKAAPESKVRKSNQSSLPDFDGLNAF